MSYGSISCVTSFACSGQISPVQTCPLYTKFTIFLVLVEEHLILTRLFVFDGWCTIK